MKYTIKRIELSDSKKAVYAITNDDGLTILGQYIDQYGFKRFNAFKTKREATAYLAKHIKDLSKQLVIEEKGN